MTNQFVTYEIALKLKELGFDESCFGIYINRGNSFSVIYLAAQDDAMMATDNDGILAPLWQQVIDWVREKHNIYISINYSKYHNLYDGIIVGDKRIQLWYLSYEKAREQAILKALTLIK